MNNMNFEAIKSINEYKGKMLFRICIKKYDGSFSYNYFYNKSISNIIKMDVNEYIKIMQKDFYGYQSGDITYFPNEKCLDRALEWVESALVIKKLKGE